MTTLVTPPAITQETMQLTLSAIGERLAPLRIADPVAERAMLHSLQKYGQQTPVVVCRLAAGKHELLDGFKRLRAGRELGYLELTARPLDVSLRACKAALLQLNRVGRTISGLEEALVVHSLCHEDGLNQVEIAALLGRHKSWVCRKLTLIERLCDEAQDSIRLGLLPASIGAELARLQRCNQEHLLAAIRKQRLTWRETREVVSALLSKPQREYEDILKDPRATVLMPDDDVVVAPVAEQGLSYPAKQMQRRLIGLERSCLEVAYLFANTELRQFTEHEEKRLRAGCARALVTLSQAQRALHEQTHSAPPLT
jgi:ParB-like chromosome segregation protein Spo0J